MNNNNKWKIENNDEKWKMENVATLDVDLKNEF